MSSHEASLFIDTLTPRQVSTFLQRKGWQRQKYPNPDLLVLISPEDAESSVVLPAHETFADYPAKLRDCVKLLSYVYQTDIPALIHQIAHWDRDVLTIRLESPFSTEQLLPLDYASQMIAKYRDFVAYAAATETEPRRFFAKLTNSGKEFAEQCMFGHTFVGSFGLTIECPLQLEPHLPKLNVPPPRPFRRAVTERIATGYADILSATENDNPEILVQNHNLGFSGNMCEILSEIYEISEGRTVSNRIIWSPELSPPQRLLPMQEPHKLDERSYRILKAASEALQTVEEPDEDKTIVGRVTRLRSEKPPIDTAEFEFEPRTIVVMWEIEKRQPLYIHIALSPDHYRQACDAHKNGRKIRVIGKPKKIRKYWTLCDHHDFCVI